MDRPKLRRSRRARLARSYIRPRIPWLQRDKSTPDRVLRDALSRTTEPDRDRRVPRISDIEVHGISRQGIVSLAARAGPWQPWRHDDLIKPLPRLPLPARGHRARRLALSLLQSESTRCR